MASISGGITVQGLGSGTDFSETIAKLKSVESMQKSRFEIWKSEWSLRVEGFQEIMTTIEETKAALASLNNFNSLMTRKATSSKEGVATAKATAEAEEGTYSLHVDKLATSAIVSTKKVYESRNSLINETGSPKEFTYTYNGTTRTIDVPNNATLEQLVSSINNDPKNPGVRASMVKTGEGYVFQLQGLDTGANNFLSVESTLAGFDSTPSFTGGTFALLPSGSADREFTYYYNGNKSTITITDGMTVNNLIDAINNETSMGITAKLVMDGADARIEFTNSNSGAVVQVATQTDVDSLKSSPSTALTSTTKINETLDDQTYTYTYEGKSYTVTVKPQGTVQDLLDAINDNPSTAGKVEADLVGGKIVFKDLTDVELTTTNETFTFTDPNSLDPLNPDTYTINVPAGTTMKEFLEELNNTLPSDYYADFEETTPGSGQWKLRIKDINTDLPVTSQGAVSSLGTIKGVDGSTVTLGLDYEAATTSTMASMGGIPPISGKDVIVNSSGSTQQFIWTDSNGTFTVHVTDGMTLQQFVTDFNAATTGVQAVLVAGDKGYSIAYVDSGGNNVTADSMTVPDAIRALRVAEGNYYVREAQDAEFTIYGWDDQVLTSSSNRLTEVFQGLDITLTGEGDTVFTVTNDIDAVKENIYAVVEAINTLRAKIQELTKYDSDKEVKEPETDDSTGVLKMASQFTWQKGSILTGNYSVQLLSSRLRTLLTSSAQGFIPKENTADAYNDWFTTLSQIGITTVAKESDSNFGLLEIDDDALTAALEKDFEGVGKLLAANREGSTSSTEFTVASVGTRAKAGVYDVEYGIDSDGQVTWVKINDAYAEPDENFPGRWTVADFDNDAAGLAIHFNGADLTGTTGKGTVQVKSGKITEFIDQLDEELSPYVETDPASAGALPSIIHNYQLIIKNIDEKIARETERLALWESRMKAKFARLETNLSKLYSNMEKAETALAQLTKVE